MKHFLCLWKRFQKIFPHFESDVSAGRASAESPLKNTAKCMLPATTRRPVAAVQETQHIIGPGNICRVSCTAATGRRVVAGNMHLAVFLSGLSSGSSSCRKRQIRSVEDFLKAFPEAKEVFIDGTERPIQRPKRQGKAESQLFGKEETPHSQEYHHQYQKETHRGFCPKQ